LQASAREKLEIVLFASASRRGGRKGVWGEFRPPYKFWAKSVRIFSNAHRQLGNVFVGSPSLPAGRQVCPATAGLAKSLPAFGGPASLILFIMDF